MNSRKLLPSAIALTVLLAACGQNETTTTKSDSSSTSNSQPASSTSSDGQDRLKPKGPKPDWGKDMHDEMAVVIEKLGELGGKPIETLTAGEARMQPTPSDAVMAVMKEKNIPMPMLAVDTMGEDIGNGVHLSIYTPKNAAGPLPLIVYYHGGGYVIATNGVYDATPRSLCDQVGAVVVSVEYRKGPEHMFPTAHMDAWAAYEWVLKNAASIKGDPKKIAVVGESAGGNLACNVSIMARDKKMMVPLCQILVYPVANNNMMTESYTAYAMAKPLNKAMMGWFVKNYVGDSTKTADPRISLVKANLKGLPPTTIINAEIDPLRDDGAALADALRSAGVTTDRKNYPGVTHEFFGMAALVPEAKEAQGFAVSALKAAFNK